MTSPSPPVDDRPRVRCGLRIRGTVQGVGFRPMVHRLAGSLGLAGFVQNDADGVWAEVEGDADPVAHFADEVRRAAPPLSRIASIDVCLLATRGDMEFRILANSTAAGARTLIPPDAAPCDDCLEELGDPRRRRYRYPFINCTACGPRYTIVRDLPYHRDRTSMADFALCAECRREYEDPTDRRFHAEPTACPACGPRLRYVGDGSERVGAAALDAAIAALGAGAIVAIKGAGGFLLAVDAACEPSVARLRARKRRPDKPLAVMARDLATVEKIAFLDGAARAVLRSAARPIVLLRTRAGAVVAPSVAPGLRELGVMLPSTPLHHLLAVAGPALQVMTSGNRAAEPIAREDEAALAKLGGVADAFLLHDRAIHTRADDSVFRIVAGAAQPVRRARGYVPEPIALPIDPAELSGLSVLAVGAQQKSSVCLTRAGSAYLSQHLGDLDHLETYDYFRETIAKLGRLLDVSPALLAHDLHPGYRSTRWALADGRPCVAVQHHHAHVASCLAEQGRSGAALGVAFDGTGCGPQGELWGGELLHFDLTGFRRIGHLRSLPLPGGEAAIREPWRLAAAALIDAGEELDLLARIDRRRLDAIRSLIAGRVAAPLSTGAGRWFDAVSALCAIRDELSYEGQPAIELEAVAASTVEPPFSFAIEAPEGKPLCVDLRPTIRAVAGALRGGAPVPLVAARFHSTMAEVVAALCRGGRESTGVETVALSGGCFQSARLTELSKQLLEAGGFEVLLHRRVPPNDGGVALGQAAVAAFRARRGSHVPGHSG